MKTETTQLKRAVREYRARIAALKRRTAALEQQLGDLKKVAPQAPISNGSDGDAGSFRFSAKGLASHRKRLGLSARECGLLLGASSLAICKWEEGKARPRARYMPAIAVLRTLGRKQASQILARQYARYRTR